MENDLIKLYSTRILALAADIPHLGRLDDPMGSHRARSVQCGSAVTVDVKIEAGRIVAFAQDVKACALGQASASVLGAQALGRSHAEIISARDALRDMLAGGPAPEAPFEGFEVLRAAESFKNRHASILLALEATAAAFEAAEGKAA
ncbi:MAG: iron-sulfur cluster assembly scaffold protein [Pseudomonadota bacterium]